MNQSAFTTPPFVEIESSSRTRQGPFTFGNNFSRKTITTPKAKINVVCATRLITTVITNNEFWHQTPKTESRLVGTDLMFFFFNLEFTGFSAIFFPGPFIPNTGI